MSSRSVYGFRIDETDKTMYHHNGGYDTLGFALLAQIKDVLLPLRGMSGIRHAVRALREASGEPTPEDIRSLEPWTTLTVGSQHISDWSCLVSKTCGDLDATLEAGYYRHYNYAINPECMYGYILNLDSGEWEYYRRISYREHRKGRYQPHGVPLKKTWPLRELPDQDEFLEEC